MSRNLLLDNTKLIMVFCVLLANVVEPLIAENVAFETVFKMIY